MKKLTYLLSLLTVVVLFTTSCGKDGAVGPAGTSGATGATGPTGATGAVGATGADGTKIYSGNGAPATTVGTTGDFYLDLTTSKFYGPKTSAGWGTPFNLKGSTGAAGATGAAGSKIYSGTSSPANTIGTDGDYYLNTALYLFYGPKTGGTWPAPISLKGQKGDTGSANVIYSDWFTPPTYATTTIFGSTTFSYNVAEPKITQEILDNGVVLVYGKLNGYNPVIWPTDQVSELPIVINYLSGTTPEIDIWSGLCSLGNVQISMKNNNNVYGSISNAHSFRYIIIPGSVHINKLINLKNYDDVKRAFSIQN